MKNKACKLIPLLLSIAMLVAMVPAASAATQMQLRDAVAAHTKAIADIEWRLETRRYTDAERLPSERMEQMRAEGARPSIYYEYIRMQMPLRGPLTESNSVSLEAFKGQLVDGFLPKNDLNIYYGMNTNSFLADVLSRMVPEPILGVKEALRSDSLIALLPGANLDAATSKEAMANISTEDALAAYGKLNLGDILLAWDDTIGVEGSSTMPTLHAMVITEFDQENRGKVTVTYPAYTNVEYSFVCSSCGMESKEGPTGYVLTEHLVSKDYKFDRFKTHQETYPESSCTGEWRALGGSTWRTETVSFEQLLGRGELSVPYASECYLPYTLPAFATGNVTPVEVKVTTDATASNLGNGFRAKVDSNYRIVRVDAVLSRFGAEDMVFTNYPEWDDWSYEYQNDELDKILREGDTSGYTLTLKVHSGPLVDKDNLSAPVTDVLQIDLHLSEPSVYLVANKDMIQQGDGVCVSVKSLEDGLTGVKMVMSYDREHFVFEQESTESMNANVSFVQQEDGTVLLTYFGQALKKDQSVAHLNFRAVRTGEYMAAMDNAKPFTATFLQVARTPNATEAEMESSRANFQPLVKVGMSTAIYRDFAPGYDMILLLADASEVTATYDGKPMFDITQSDYRVDGVGFSHIYGYVTKNADPGLISATYIGQEPDLSTTYRQVKVDMDVDRNGGVGIEDVQLICHIVKGHIPLGENVEQFLIADVDRNGKIDMEDAKAVFAALN